MFFGVRIHNWYWWVVSGLCLFVVWLHPIASVLFLPGLVCFLWAVETVPTQTRCFWGGLLVGTAKGLGAIVWVWYVYPLTWAGFEPGIGQLVLIGVYWVAAALILGVGTGLISIVLKQLPRLSITLWLFPALWIGSELLGSFLFSLYSLGPGIVPNIYLSFGYIGYALIDWQLFYGVAALGGIYALSLVAVGISSILYAIVRYPAWRETRRMATMFFLLLIVTVGIVSYGQYQLNYERSQIKHQQSIIAVTTEFDPDAVRETGVRERYAATQAAVQAALGYNPDIILLPEDTRLVQSFQSTSSAFAFINTHASNDVIVIDSGLAKAGDEATAMRANIFDTRNQQLYYLDKQYLAPQGEFMPYIHDFLFGLFGDEHLVALIRLGRNQQPGPLRSYVGIPDTVPSLLFCMESVNPLGVWQVLKQRDSQIVLHPVSHGWFHSPTILWTQLERMLRTQALWNNVAIIQAGNMSHSFMIDNQGIRQAGTVLASGEGWELRQLTP